MHYLVFTKSDYKSNVWDRLVGTTSRKLSHTYLLNDVETEIDYKFGPIDLSSNFVFGPSVQVAEDRRNKLAYMRSDGQGLSIHDFEDLSV